jgi:hypothetical protein
MEPGASRQEARMKLTLQLNDGGAYDEIIEGELLGQFVGHRSIKDAPDPVCYFKTLEYFKQVGIPAPKRLLNLRDKVLDGCGYETRWSYGKALKLNGPATRAMRELDYDPPAGDLIWFARFKSFRHHGLVDKDIAFICSQVDYEHVLTGCDGDVARSLCFPFNISSEQFVRALKKAACLKDAPEIYPKHLPLLTWDVLLQLTGKQFKQLLRCASDKFGVPGGEFKEAVIRGKMMAAMNKGALNSDQMKDLDNELYIISSRERNILWKLVQKRWFCSSTAIELSTAGLTGTASMLADQGNICSAEDAVPVIKALEEIQIPKTMALARAAGLPYLEYPPAAAVPEAPAEPVEAESAPLNSVPNPTPELVTA